MYRTAVEEGFKPFSAFTASLLEPICDWAFITDEAFVIKCAHKCRKASYDILPRNLIGQALPSFLPESARQEVMAQLTASRQGQCETVYSDPLTGLNRIVAAPLAQQGLRGYTVTVSHISDETLGHLRREVYGDAYRTMDQHASLQLGQQRLLADLAFKFAKDPTNNVDRLFNETLAQLGTFMGVDRCLIFRHDFVHRTYSVLYEWHADNVHPNKAILQNIPYNDDDEGFIQLTTRPYIAIDDTFQFTGEAYRIQRESGVHAFVDLPILCDGQFWGFLGADYGSGPHYWRDSEFHMLQTIGGILSASLEKQVMHHRLEAAIAQATEASHAKTDFLSRMSHEIRTPMNAIIGMNEIAKKSDDAERIQYCLGKIDQASHQLLGLINDILDLSKIESGKMEIVRQPFDFEQMLEQTLAVIQARLDEKEQRFSFDIGSPCTHALISDELRLSQVIINLLSNAVKFTPHGGSIVLRTHLSSEDGHTTLRVEVEDTGIGIAKEDQPKLFRSFEQADGSITRRFGGTGLGLSICKNIIALMGGHIWVESEPRHGSRFIFQVPVDIGSPLSSLASPPPAPPSEQPDVCWQGKTILLAEDIEINQEVLLNLLSPTGVKIDCAGNGAEAVMLYMAAPQRYNLVLMDVQMPEVDGYEATRRIRTSGRPGAEHIPILAMTANAFSEDVEKCLAVGMNGHVAKPIDIDELMDKVGGALSGSMSSLH